VTREEAIARLRAVVDADDRVQQTRARLGEVIHVGGMRAAYAARERADREAWGTCADDRAAFARELLALLAEAP
jgi:hypothetical protein